ncbi:MAG TPA: SH3 domain-containing protein, partial [Bacteroidota bacterium]|nr:SH3 domain-containing protein [Bacteroidota bacterium]
KSAPDNQSTDLFVLHEGVTVEVLDAVGDWRKIRLADGKVGWMMLSNMELI